MKTICLFLLGMLMAALFISVSTAQAWNGELPFGPESREEMLRRARQMVEFSWSPKATFTNLTLVSPASYPFTIGQIYTGETYTQDNPQQDWAEFYDAVSNKISAGGNYYLGNDCSGFVSVSWKLPTRYDTATFESDATADGGYVTSLGAKSVGQPINGLLPGDALVRRDALVKHIILFESYSADGRGINDLEQTPGWARSKYRTWSELSSYRPIRRNNIDDYVNAPPAVPWAKTYGSSSKSEFAYSIQQTSDGGYILAGDAYSYGPYVYKDLVLKLDPNGNILWQRSYGSSDDDHAFYVQQTMDGGYIVCGSTEIDYSPYGWFYKLDSSGNLQWQKRGLGYYGTNSVQQTSDGGYIVAGNGPGGNGDTYIWKLDTNGNIQWQKTYGLLIDGYYKTDWAVKIRQTLDGGYVVAGEYDLTYSWNDIRILRLNASGAILWEKRFGNSDDNQIHDIKQAVDGGYILAGANVNPNESGYAWIWKLDSSGNIKWQKNYGGTNFGYAKSVQQTQDGGYIVAGHDNSNSWILKLDANGNTQWDKTFSISIGYLESISEIYGGYILAGSQWNYSTSSSDVLVYNLALEKKFPSRPISLTATAVSSNQINLSWEQTSNNETGFDVKRKQGIRGTYSVIKEGLPPNTTIFTDTVPGPDTYYYTVYAKNGSLYSAYSNEASATISPAAPVAPTNFTINAVTTDQVVVSWIDNSTDETGFKIERKTGTGGTYSQIATVSANTTTYSDTGLTDNTTYYYKAKAFNAGGDSSYSNEVSATTITALPAAPTNLTANTVSASQINLNWADNATNETGFKIERKTGGGTYAQIATVSANVTAYSDTGLASNTIYYYRVRANNTAGDSSYSNEVSATTITAIPAAPTNLTASVISSTQINLNWTDNAINEQGFKIERKIGVGGTYSQIAIVSTNVTTYSDTGLTVNMTYYYRVRANNTDGDSGYSNEANATTQQCQPSVRIGSTYYSTLQEAYNAAQTGSIIQSQAITFYETLIVNRNISVTLQGGYDCNYTTNSGNISLLKGMIQTFMGGGTLTISNFNLIQ
ncbi:MAG: fibronectin type III domain-containing protein [Thermodesulfovibrionales bacterium]